jgi:hypothetical protein
MEIKVNCLNCRKIREKTVRLSDKAEIKFYMCSETWTPIIMLDRYCTTDKYDPLITDSRSLREYGLN